MSNDPLAPPPPDPEPPGQPVADALPAQTAPTSDERAMALLCHLGGVLATIGFLVPLIIWLVKKDESRFVDDQGKEALNFQLTLLIGHVIGIATWCFIIGIAITFALWVVQVVFGIMGAVAANQGQRYRYPVNIRLIS